MNLTYILLTSHGNILRRYLRPIDILILRRTCRGFQSLKFFIDVNNPQGTLHDLFVRFLTDKVYSAENLLNMLHKTASVISGSVVLQVLYNEDWSESNQLNHPDVDIYTLSNSNTCHEANPEMDHHHINSDDDINKEEFRLVRNLFYHGYKFVSSDIEGSLSCCIDRYGLLPFISMTLAQVEGEVDSEPLDSFCLMEGEKSVGWSINQIFIPSNLITDHAGKIRIILDQIDRYFDLSCCKIAFDGTRLFIYGSNGLIDLVKRQSTIDFDFTKYRNLEAKLQHPLRGYYLKIGTRPVQDHIQLCRTRLHERKRKYETRGFTIAGV